ncbi:MAG: PilT/PilU family type 4a pilus ATPase [Caldiserica bacterium]|jgi:pilus retraction protein PilT|nr:PilT/PilU family type 4a pilus ATPase [Caldisericota bacterium]
MVDILDRLQEWLKTARERDASDLYIKAFSPPVLRIYNQFHPLEEKGLSPEETQELAFSLMSPDQKERFRRYLQVNLAYWKPEVGRFRVNIYRQRETIACVFRTVRDQIPSFEELRLPELLKAMALEKRGLILITGAAGMGKSTTLACLIDYRNNTLPGHIITLEDPIEYLHRDKKSLISQREISLDAISFSMGLKDALRQTPDVIVIGEIRDYETVKAALHFSETGHLVFGTLHSTNVVAALERLVSFFPSTSQGQAFIEISLNLRAVISQILLPRADADGLVLVCEILVNTPYVRELIRNGNLTEIPGAIRKGSYDGMQTFDQAIYQLYEQKLISEEDAIAFAQSPNEMKLRLKGLYGKEF